MKTKIDSQNCQKCAEPDIYCRCSKHTPTIELYGDGQGYTEEFLQERLGISLHRGREIIHAVNAHKELRRRLMLRPAMSEQDPNNPRNFDKLQTPKERPAMSEKTMTCTKSDTLFCDLCEGFTWCEKCNKGWHCTLCGSHSIRENKPHICDPIVCEHGETFECPKCCTQAITKATEGR